MDMFLAFYLFREQLKELFQVIIKVFLHAIHHSLMVIFNDTFPNILAFQLNSLLAPCDGVYQVSIVVIGFVVEVILLDDVLLLPQEVIDLVLIAISSIVLLA